MKTAVVLGGYGVFGSLVARELAARGVPLVIAGRDAARAEAFARELGPAHSGVRLDATDRAACRAALGPDRIAVNCAGPFSALGEALLEAALDAGSHSVDIADDRAFAARVRALGPRFEERGLLAVSGCSSLPAISCALALVAAGSRGGAPPERARVTLFIGNDNPKGKAAVASAVHLLGRPIAAPQGTLYGFRGGERVEVPAPFGPRRVYEFESPDYDVLPRLLGVREVRVKVGFESRLATLGFAALAALWGGWGDRTAAVAAWAGALAPRFGHSGGAVVSELWWADGHTARASLACASEGQRMAALPAAIVARALAEGRAQAPPGARDAWDVLGARAMLDELAASGCAIASS